MCFLEFRIILAQVGYEVWTYTRILDTEHTRRHN